MEKHNDNPLDETIPVFDPSEAGSTPEPAEAAPTSTAPESTSSKKISRRSNAKLSSARTATQTSEPAPELEAASEAEAVSSSAEPVLPVLPLEAALGAAVAAPEPEVTSATAGKKKKHKAKSKSATEPSSLTDNGIEAVAMTAGANLAEAGRTLLRQQLEKLHNAEPVAREGSDPEGVHDMRVATRRLRAMLKVLEESVYEPEITAEFRGKLRKLANALGATRDNDVFLEHLKAYFAELSPEEQAGLQPLLDAVNDLRDAARHEMLKVLDSAKTTRLLARLEKFVNKPGAGVRRKAAKNEMAPNLVRHFAGSAILRRYEEVLAYESVINPQTPIEVLHRLRVACKRLRYTLEFFQEALPDTVKALHKQLTSIQDDLGELHDHQVAIELCKEILSDHPEDVALHLYQSRRAADIVKAREAFTAKWQGLSGSDYRQALTGAIGKLGSW